MYTVCNPITPAGLQTCGYEGYLKGGNCMSNFVKILDADQLSPGQITAVTLTGHAIGLFNSMMDLLS